ncbi:MAG TPA: DUF2505 family protein [Kofleriaceae bacterium]|nr:DUF2505 family protein [Kofleriaceae bacterium]
MIRFTCDHRLHRTAAAWWAWYFDPPAISDFFTRGLGFKRYDVTQQVEHAGTIERSVACHPDVALPRAVRMLFLGGFRYVESGVFSKSDNTWRFHWDPSTFPERLTVNGRMTVVDDGAADCRRTVEITLDARFAGVGRLVEHTAQRVLRQIWDRSAVVMNDWFRPDHRTENVLTAPR